MSGDFYPQYCNSCQQYVYGPHTCQPVYHDHWPTYYHNPPVIDEETKEFLRRIVDALEKMVPK